MCVSIAFTIALLILNFIIFIPIFNVTNKYNYIENHQYSSVGHLPGTGPVAGAASSASHLGLYGFMTIMPLTGIGMGMYGGKGLPFFWTTIPGFEKKNGKLAGQVSTISIFVFKYASLLLPKTL